ncbi:TRAP transporter substrate-binding protein [Porticoccus sp. GXU_MW_L64]
MKLQIMKLLLATTLVGFLASCGGKESPQGEAAVQPQKVYKWKMVTTWPKNFPGLGTAPEKFAKMVDDMSNGRLKIKVYGAGQLVPALEVFDAVSRGTAEMGHGAAYYWKGKAPAAVLFATYPFGLNAQELNGWLHYGGGLELWRELYEPFNLVPYAGGNTGVQMGGWYNREINSLEDLKGLKMRMPGLGGEVIKRAGAEAVNIPGGELFTSMQTGVIDATEWVGPANDLAFSFHQVAKYYYYPGWQEPGPALEIIVNKDKLETLPADLQAIVEVAARAASTDMLDSYTATNAGALDALVNEQGVEVRPLPDDVLKELYRISEQVLQEQSAADPMFAKVYKSINDYRTQVRKYHKLTEQEYYRVRDLDK